MTIHEFGAENKNVIVRIHPSLVMWDYFEYLIPLMQNRYHLIIPALPGYFIAVRDFLMIYMGHGGLAALQPKRLMRGLERVMDGGGKDVLGQSIRNI